MERETFWRIVGAARAAGRDDLDARVEALRAELSRLGCRDLQEFQQHYDALHAEAYRWDLWGAAYLMLEGCSDDGFHYFRAWLISEGQAVYEVAFQDPDSLAGLPLVEVADNECFGYVAEEVYKEKTGREMPRSQSNQPAMPRGERWEEADLDRLFPRLVEQYCA